MTDAPAPGGTGTSRRPVVAHVLNSIGLGGVPETAWQLMRRLPADRYDQRVYALRRAAGEEGARAARQGRMEEHGVPVTFPRADGKVAVIADLCRWLVDERVDLVHTHSYRPNLLGRLAAVPLRDAGLRIVAHHHNRYDDMWEAEGTLTLERRLTDATARVLAVSRAVGEQVAALLGVDAARLAVVPNGVEAERFAGGDRAAARAWLGIDADRPVVALVGRISPEKGQEDLVRAIPEVVAAHPDALFLLVGSTAKEAVAEPLTEIARARRVRDAVRFTGYVEDMPALYSAIDVLAAPSRWEGFGLTLVEAMAAGVPVVASDVGGIPEVVGDGPAMLVPPRDPDALGAALSRVIADRDAAAAMAAAGRERAAAFSWDRSADRLAGIYDAVLDGRP
jgi:glycosyltransferase involved in cell wall biosynthesis